MKHPHAVVFTVSNIDVAVAVHIDTVRPGEPACFRISIRAIPHTSIAHQCLDGSVSGADDTDRMALGVRQVDIPIRTQGDSLRSGQCRVKGRAAVARESFFTSTGQVMQRLYFEVDAVHGISLSECKIERMPAVKIERSRAVERSAVDPGSIRSRFAFARAGKRVDGSRFEINDSNSMIPNVADVQVPVIVESDGMRSRKPGTNRRSPVAGKSPLARAGHC